MQCSAAILLEGKGQLSFWKVKVVHNLEAVLNLRRNILPSELDRLPFLQRPNQFLVFLFMEKRISLPGGAILVTSPTCSQVLPLICGRG